MKCRACEQAKPDTEFQKNPRAPGGRNGVCNTCVTAKYVGTNGTRGRKIEREIVDQEREVKKLEMKRKLIEMGFGDVLG